MIDLKEVENGFRERFKKLTCLYRISRLVEKPEVSLEKIISGTLELIPPAWQFPKVTGARITYDKKLYKTENFKETEWKLATRVEVNEKQMEIEVHYLEDKPFPKEEVNLLNDIGKRLKVILEHMEAEQKLRESEYNLEERVKELNCLYRITQLIEKPDTSYKEIIRGTLELIPPAWQFPEMTCARITYDRKSYKTGNFKETEWKLTSRIEIYQKPMEIEIYYLEDNPFLKEEVNLLNDIGKRLKVSFGQIEAKQKLKESVIPERKKMEIRMRGREKLLLHVQETFGLGYWDWNIVTGDLYWSDETFHIYGFKSQEFVPTYEKFRSIVHPEDIEYVQSHIDSALQNDIKYNIDFRFVRPNGEIRFLYCQGDVTRDKKGKAIRFVGTQIDITERKKKEVELQFQSEIIENMSEGVFLIKLEDGTIVYTNPTFEEMFGYNPGEIIGKNVAIVNAPVDKTPEEIREEIMGILEDTGEWHGEVLNVKKDGTPFWCYANVSLFDHPQYGTTIVSVHTDITERKKVEDNLRLYSQIITNMYDAVNLVRENDGIIVYTNPRFEEIFGYNPGELIGKHVSILNAPTSISPEEMVKNVIKILKENGTWQGEIKNIKKDGTLFWCHINVSGFKHLEYGNVWVAVQTDITERKIAEQISKDSEKKYRILFEQAVDPIILIDTKTGDIVDFNDKMNENLGYTREEFKSLRIPDFDLMVNFKEYKARIDKIVRDGQEIFETKYIRKNGEIRDILVTANLIKISGKDYLEAIFRDITNIKKRERQLKKSKEKLSNVNNISIILGLVLSAFYLLIEGLLDTYFFFETEFLFQDIFTINLHENIMHLIPTSLILFISIFSQYLINTLRKTEEKLKESEEKFRTIAEQSLMGIFVVQDDVIKYANQRMAEINGYSSEEILNWQPKEHLKTLSKESLPFALEQKRRQKSGLSDVRSQFQLQIIKKSGEKLWIENFTTPIHFKGRSANLVTFFDITDKVETEQKLKESEQRYRGLYEDAPYAYFTLKPDKSIKSCNQAAVELLGYNKEEFQNMMVFDLYNNSPEGLQKAKGVFKKFLEGKKNQDVELQMKHKNGNMIWVSLTVKPVMDKEGQIIESRLLVKNITERKRTEELIIEENQKLAELNKIKKNLITRVSHELKTPLNSISSSIHILMNFYQDRMDKEILEFNYIISKGCERLKKLIEDLMDISKLDHSKIILKKKEGDIVGTLLSCVSEIKLMANQRNLNIINDLPKVFFIAFDELRIEQVFINILSNAVKFTPPNGSIFISLKENYKDIEISVKDTGIGLTKDEMKHLFKRFGKIERYGEQMEVDIEGSGLGLYIAKQIIELHSGDIIVESEGRNKGSIFTIRLNK